MLRSFCLGILLTLTTFPCFATPICNGTYDKPCNVWDSINNPTQVKHFRFLRLISTQYLGNRAGTDNLTLSGSGAPSEAGWKTIKHVIENAAPKTKHIFVLDLRQEIHAYFNKDSVTNMVYHNWINLNKSPNEAQYAELNWVLHSASPLYVLNNDQFKAKQFNAGKHVPVDTLRTEKQVVEQNGMVYVRFTVTDHMAPRDDEVDRFIHFLTTLTPNDWLHIHCRGGEGRTVTFFSMYDMLHNADKVSFEEIIKRQASIPPYYNLADFNRDPDLKVYFIMRYEFLKEFYAYARGRLKGDSRTWTQYHHPQTPENT